MNIIKLLRSLLMCILFINQVSSQTFPSGFSQVKFATIDSLSAMAFAPDGRLFACQKNGIVRIIKNGAILNTPFLKLTVDENGERGISGIAFDPNFNTNHYVYIYYTRPAPNIHNRLSRFTANGDVVMSGSELALLDAEPVTAVFHNGGGLGFGADGKLYLSMGEDNKPSNAQNLGTYKGKLLRINKDGSAPADNPYHSSTSEITKRIWCLGLRNPYTLSIQPGTGKIFINNVGADSWEEIHDGTSPDQNFGWPEVEGSSTNPAYVNPIFSYPHESTGQHGCALVGGTFFNPASTNYPASYSGRYFYMDYCNGWLYYLTLGSPVKNNSFATNLGTKNLALQVGPDGNLYYIKRDDAKAGIYKIIYSNNNSPVITDQPDSKTITQGQSVSFSVSASGATPLSYQWRKGGVDITGANAATYTINNVQSSHAGQYSVKVTNSYGSAISNNATLTVSAFNASPNATINTPATGTHYHAGDVISFSGSATDAEDGTLPASAFQWTVEFWHNNNHFHPGPTITSGVKSGSFTIPNTGENSAEVFYKLKLKVTDSNGLIDTEHVDITPITSTITLASVPPGLKVLLDDHPYETVSTVVAVAGMIRNLNTTSPQTLNDSIYEFDHWLDGGAMSHDFTVSDVNKTYTAVFKANGSKGCNASGSITREVWNNITGTSLSDVPFTSPPSNTSGRTSFEAPTNVADNYGSRMRGYICPPVTGNYIFWIASDNNSELWLSTDDQPGNKVKIASVTGYTSPRNWTKYPSQKSAPISLTAGATYYIEAIHKENTQGDALAVGWQLPGGTLERPIPGSRLSPFKTASCDATITAGGSLTFCSGGSVKLNTNTGTGFSYQWKKDGTQISGATSSSYTATSAGDYQVRISAGDCVDWSAPAQVRINSTLTAKITPGGQLIFCSGGNVKLYANTCNNYIYQWRKNGVDIPGATASSYTATTGGDYQVKIAQGSAMAWSAKLTVVVISCSGADRDTIENVTETPAFSSLSDDHFKINVNLNPNTGTFSFDVCIEEATEETMNVKVVNYLGQTVYEKPAHRINGCIRETVELNNALPDGVYILQLMIGTKTESARILLAK